MEIWRLLVNGGGRRLQAVRAELCVADSGAHRDGLVEVRVLSEHLAQLQSLVVIGMLLAARGRSSVHMVTHDTLKARNRRSALRGA